jgi:tetraacyldisaccharide 4'-kinase
MRRDTSPLPEAVYHAAARARRRWFARHPEARRTLEQPVISVGNLTFGGSGKTPIVAAIATLARSRQPR